MTHLLSLGPAADLQTLALADGHLHAERDPHMLQVLRLGGKGQAFHVGLLVPTQSQAHWMTTQRTPCLRGHSYHQDVLNNNHHYIHTMVLVLVNMGVGY